MSFQSTAIRSFATLALAAARVAFAAELQPYEVRYEFIYSGMHAGSVVTTLGVSDGGRWSAQRVTQPRGLARLLTATSREQSDLELSAGSVRPMSYSGSNGTTEHDVRLSFDWTRQRATGTIGGKPVDEALKPGMQDDLSMLIAFTFELANGRMPGAVTTIGDSGVRDYQLTREREEKLHTAIGDIDTVVYRAQRSGSPRSTRYWCAVSLGYLPLRAEQRRLDDVQWTMEIASLKR